MQSRSRPVIAVLDEDLEDHSTQAGSCTSLAAIFGHSDLILIMDQISGFEANQEVLLI